MSKKLYTLFLKVIFSIVPRALFDITIYCTYNVLNGYLNITLRSLVVKSKQIQP